VASAKQGRFIEQRGCGRHGTTTSTANYGTAAHPLQMSRNAATHGAARSRKNLKKRKNVAGQVVVWALRGLNVMASGKAVAAKKTSACGYPSGRKTQFCAEFNDLDIGRATSCNHKVRALVSIYSLATKMDFEKLCCCSATMSTHLYCFEQFREGVWTGSVNGELLSVASNAHLRCLI
jgi:hypothetical protein